MSSIQTDKTAAISPVIRVYGNEIPRKNFRNFHIFESFGNIYDSEDRIIVVSDFKRRNNMIKYDDNNREEVTSLRCDGMTNMSNFCQKSDASDWPEKKYIFILD